MSREALLNNVTELVKNQLKPLVEDIDRKGLYPEDFLCNLGAISSFMLVGNAEEGDTGYGLATQIAILHEVAKEHGAISSDVQCQAACAWYLYRSPSPEVKKKYLAEILQGGILAGTSMSNTVKHLAEIGKHNLQAVRTDGDYIVSGTLPWVSNIGEEHIQANTAQIDGGYVMFITGRERDGISLQNCPEFYALEGIRTYGLTFEDVLIENEDVIAASEQFVAYIQSIKASFILLQIGIGAGAIDGSLEVIHEADAAHVEANRYLDDDYDSLKTRLDGAWAETERLADLAWNNRPDNLVTLKLRAAASELALTALQSAVLHAGAKGYPMHNPAQCRLREAMFIAIVTPTLKHLRREIVAWEGS